MDEQCESDNVLSKESSTEMQLKPSKRISQNSKLQVNEISLELPCKPKKPAESDCCGSGCIPCVFDIYDQEVKIWEQECARLKNEALFGFSNQTDEELLSELEYRKFTITDIWSETADSNRYRFYLPYYKSLGLKIGQHIIVRGITSNESITRQYTPVSPVTCTGYFDLVIKIYKDGKLSSVIKQWKVGDNVEIRGPFGSLNYHKEMPNRIIMLAAGTGIAPMSQVIQGILNNEDDESFIQLLYGCRTYRDILLKKEIDEWAGYWNFTATFALSQENDGHYRYGDKVHEGRIDKTLLENEFCGKSMNKSMILICGTRSFDEDMIALCQELGFSRGQIHKF